MRSDAKCTIESAIIDGMAANPHLTGLRIDRADVLVPDLLVSIFRPSTRWAVRQYLDELEANDDA